MIPIHDDNPTSRAPILTLGLIAACIGAFVWLSDLSFIDQYSALVAFGVVPAAVTGQLALRSPYLDGFPPEAAFLTMMFLHAGWLHLGGNMLYLWIFGNNVEDRLGHGRFVALYLVAGVAATAAYIMLNPSSDVPLIGASGAISGVLGAYLLLYPFARIRMIVPPFLFRTFKVPAWLFLGFWFVFQSFAAAGDAVIAEDIPTGGVAWSAHVAGFLTGIVLLLMLRPKGVMLFNRGGGGRRKASGSARTGAPTRPGPWGGAHSYAEASEPAAARSRVPTVQGSAGPIVRHVVRRPRRTVDR
ncbi:MAG: rhomboid family intramembrane serine protease [Alphaproteobacteria bacterium]